MAATETLLNGATQVTSSLSANYTAGGGTMALPFALADHGFTPLTGPFEILVGRNRPSSERRYFVATPSGSNLTVVASSGYTDNQNYIAGDLIDVISAWETQRRQNAFDLLHTHTGGVDGTGLPTSALASGTLVAARFATAPGILTAAMVADQAANLILGGPASGGSAAPGFRALALADLPTISQRARVTGSTSGPTTTSASFVVVTDLTITLTTGGGDLLAWTSLPVENSSAGVGVFGGLAIDASTTTLAEVITKTANQAETMVMCWLFTGVSAASHTVDVRWLTGGGTAKSLSTMRQLIVLELRK